jgi:PhnB protein
MAKKTKKAAKKKTAKKSAKKAAKKSAPRKAAKKTAKKSAPRKAASKKAAPAPAKRSVAINPYLTFNGNCEEAFNFYRGVFGGNFVYVGRFKDMPPQEGHPPMSEEAGNLIMHISLPIGTSGSLLMGSDSSEEFGKATTVGNNFTVSVSATSTAEADKIFKGLSNGGQVTMPMGKTFWGSYFGMCTDKYGIQWMMSYDERPM